MTIVFKLSDNLKPKVIKYYSDKLRPNNPPYSIFQAEEGGTIITLYQSGKIMFQGISADIDANIWIDLEKRFNDRNIMQEINGDKAKKEKKKEKDNSISFHHLATIGSDEVGTGDYFGPIIVTASYVSKENIPFVSGLGVKDSKKLTDLDIKKIAPELMKKIPYVSQCLDNETYNKMQQDGINMNKTKAILHNKVLASLIKQDNYDYDKIVVDQFEYPKAYYAHVSGAKEIVRNITFVTKGEDKCLAVAVSSVISRYLFLKKMDELSTIYKVNLPKGASDAVDKVAKQFYDKDQLTTLSKIAKLNFKNTEKIKNM